MARETGGGKPPDVAFVEVIAGVNLPMLVKLAKVRGNQPLADAVDCAQDAGRKYIAAASHVLPHCRMAPDPAIHAVPCAADPLPKLNGRIG